MKMIEESNKIIEQIAREGSHSLEMTFENFAIFGVCSFILIGIVICFNKIKSPAGLVFCIGGIIASAAFILSAFGIVSDEELQCKLFWFSIFVGGICFPTALILSIAEK
ncbi:hypothetical protein CFF98v445_06035 [Campylobacter fetus subsp. fetus]|nr:hypothetical protein [Campylobacter hyointestinalis]OCS15056.1 hypothetical protein CFF98v445_06035 [Campylobacter fetus subsp. fetus]PPB52903.1 hypothetical protein CDQ67_09485 [Campylobacter hyointestinalis subsp. hyointestinalis]